MNGAAISSLAEAPLAPVVARIDREKLGYDAVLRWSQSEPEPNLAGYVAVMRATTAPHWERAIAVGNVHEYTLPNVSIDDVVFGVKAVDRSGNESLVAPWTIMAFPNEKIEHTGKRPNSTQPGSEYYNQDIGRAGGAYFCTNSYCRR